MSTLKGIMSATNSTLQNEGTLIDAGTGGRIEIDGTAVLNTVGLFDLRDNLLWDNVINPVRSPTFKNSAMLRKSVGKCISLLMTLSLTTLARSEWRLAGS